jgi:hypothetical protein
MIGVDSASDMDLSLDKTGARPGDVIVGYRCTGAGVILRLQDTVYPIRERVEEAFAEQGFLARLGSIEFFSRMTEDERRRYLLKVALDRHMDMADQRVEAELIDPGSLVSTCGADPEAVEAFVGKVVSLETLRALVPGKADTRALHHTLAFYPQFYRVQTQPAFVQGYRGLLVYPQEADGLVRVGATTSRCVVLRDFHNGTVELALPIGGNHNNPPVSTPGELYHRVFQERFGQIPVVTLPNVPSFLKSVLQKIIRVRPVEVEARGVRYPSGLYLCSVFTQLLLHSGAFVPDIQRFVTGQESAIKRLVVSCLEDSSGDPGTLLLALVMAAATQRHREYHPDEEDYRLLLDLCVDCLETEELFNWDISGPEGTYHPYQLSETSTDLQNLSAVLDDIRSFGSDLQMARSIAARNGAFRVVADRPPRVQVMHIWHAIDQHCMPEVVYHMRRDLVKEYAVPGRCPFSELFTQIFRQVTGVNGRCGPRYPQMLVEEVRRVQEILYRSTVPSANPKGKEPEPDYTDENEEFDITLTTADLAGAIGVVDVHVRGVGNCMVTMHPEDPNRLIAVRRPSRNVRAEDCNLSPEDETQVLLEAYRKICRGVRLVSPGTHLHGLTATCVDSRNSTVRSLANPRSSCSSSGSSSGSLLVVPFVERLRFTSSKSGSRPLTWEQVRRHTYVFPLFCRSPEELLGDQPRVVYHEGLHSDADAILRAIRESYSQQEVRRCLSHICNRRRVEVPRVSRDGGGTRDVVRQEDVGAFQLLTDISRLYPAAITPEGPTSFRVNNLSLLRCVTDILRDIPEIQAPAVEHIWHTPGDNTGRTPRDYQTDSVEEMIESMPHKRGHFIWIPVGMGKTWILLEFFRRILRGPLGRASHQSPTYIIYTLPRSAAASVIKEIEYFGMPVNMIIPIKAKHPLRALERHRLPMAGCINIIEHDHLRLAEESLLDVADQSIFVIDEVHKALNDTKRTGICLEISRLCLRFIAMTGTPVVDNETYKLQWWLEQLVSFPVTDTNFWVATNAMTARRVGTGIRIDRQEVPVDMADSREVPPEAYQQYRRLVAPELGGTNTRPSDQQIRQAFRLCWDICERRCAELTVQLLREGSRGVMLVARDREAQERLRGMLAGLLGEASSNHKSLRVVDTYLLTGSIVLTDERNSEVDQPGRWVRVVIVPMSKSEGYTLTRCDTQVTSVYFGNQATRQQLDGRINRNSQRAPVIRYRTVHCGLLTHVLRNHNNAANLNAVLQAMTGGK